MTRILVAVSMLLWVGCLEPQKTSRRTKVPGPPTQTIDCETFGSGGESDGRDGCQCKTGYQMLEDQATCALTVCLESGGSWDADSCECGESEEFDADNGCESTVECDEGKFVVKGACYTAQQKVRIEKCETATDTASAGIWEVDTFTCECPADHQIISGECRARPTVVDTRQICTQSPSGQWVNNQCQCRYPYIVQDGACVANPQIVAACTSVNGTWNTDASPQRCDCAMGDNMIANRCWPCGPGTVRLAGATACVAMATVERNDCLLVPGLLWDEVFGRCIHHDGDAIATLDMAACSANGYSWAANRCFPGPLQNLSREDCEGFELPDVSWSSSLALCLAGQTEAEYVLQTGELCPGIFDTFLGRCLPRAMAFSQPVCAMLGFYWMNDLEAASAAMTGPTQGVCLPVTLSAGLSTTVREEAIRDAFRPYTALDNNNLECRAERNRAVLSWDDDLRVCLPGRLPRTNGVLTAPVTLVQCNRFGRHWIPGYGLDGLGKCYADSLETINGHHGDPSACTTAGYFYSQRYFRCFPDNPENPQNPRSQDRDSMHLLSQPRCSQLDLDWVNNECTHSEQDRYNTIETKAACLAGFDANDSDDDGFWIDYYKRCFANEPPNYRVAFGPSVPNDCSTYGLVWSADHSVCLRQDIATTARYTQAECEMSGTFGDRTSGDGFLCSQAGYQYWHPSGSDSATGGFYPCSSPLEWSASMRACLPKQNFQVDRSACEDDLSFNWHDISQNNIPLADIGRCTQQTLAAIRDMDQPTCGGAGLHWGGAAVGCLPDALPALGSSVNGQPNAQRRRYMRVCNYYAGLPNAATGTAQRTPQQKGWLENFEFCLLQHTPSELVALAGPTTGQTAAQSACEQAGYSWHVGMNMCVPRADSAASPTNDANRSESLSPNFCRELGFQYDTTWNTCYESNIDFSVGFNAIFRDPGETDAQVAVQCQSAARGRFFWSAPLTSCFPALALNRDCPDNNAQGSAQHIVRDNNQCGAISSLVEAECRAYEGRNDSARYLGLRWWTDGGGDRCLVPGNALLCTGELISNGAACVDFRTFDQTTCAGYSDLVWSPVMGARLDGQSNAMQGCFRRTNVPSIFASGEINLINQSITAEEIYEVLPATSPIGTGYVSGPLECTRNSVLGVVRSFTGRWESNVIDIGLPSSGGGPTIPQKLLCSQLRDGLEVDTATFQDVVPSGNEHWARCPTNYVMTGACFSANIIFPTCEGSTDRHFKARCHRIKIRGTTTLLNIDQGTLQTFSGNVANQNPGPFAPTRAQIGRHRVLTGGCFRTDGNCAGNKSYASEQRELAPSSQFFGQ